MAFRKRLQPLAGTNALQLAKGESGCCGDDTTICKYSAAFEKDEAIVSLTYTNQDGDATVATLATPAELTDPGAVIKGITNALLAEGIITDDNIPHILVYDDLVASPDNVIIDIFADFAITLITSDEPDTEVPTVTCAENVACRYEFEIEADADVDLVLDDALDPSPQTVSNLNTSGGAAANTAVSVAIGGALDTLYGDGYKRIFVKWNAVTSTHKVNFWLYSRLNQPTVNIEAAGAVAITLCECKTDYTA